ncbi:MAG: hypothetical protein IPG89_16225 [Bacteroidetes bacterium]|nr:hypothetical protein [Bacteroidota bacterium]
MKTKLLIFFASITFISQAQTLSKTNFISDGYPITAGFPTKIDKSTKQSVNDTVLTVTSTSNGSTYALSCSKVKSTEIAVKSIPGIISRTEKKATRVDSKTTSTIDGETSTLIKYVNDKGTNITLQLFQEGRIVYQAFILNKTAFVSDDIANAYFNSISLSKTIESPKNNTTTTASVTPNTTTPPTNTGATTNTLANNTTASTNTAWAVNDRAEIFDAKEKKWFGCIILKVNSNGTYKIGYDGYADTYDEDVAADRLNKPTSNTTPAKPSYVKAVKGQTITIKGNLKSGEIMEDLEWAESSSMACWVGIRNIEFEGNHVAYWFDLPKKSIVKITVTPTSDKKRINIYGYSGFDFIKTPPEVSRCTSCEASFPEWVGQPNLNEPSKPQTIEFNATTIRNRVYFAVAGAKGVTEGDYTITIELK